TAGVSGWSRSWGKAPRFTSPSPLSEPMSNERRGIDGRAGFSEGENRGVQKGAPAGGGHSSGDDAGAGHEGKPAEDPGAGHPRHGLAEGRQRRLDFLQLDG